MLMFLRSIPYCSSVDVFVFSRFSRWAHIRSDKGRSTGHRTGGLVPASDAAGFRYYLAWCVLQIGYLQMYDRLYLGWWVKDTRDSQAYLQTSSVNITEKIYSKRMIYLYSVNQIIGEKRLIESRSCRAHRVEFLYLFFLPALSRPRRGLCTSIATKFIGCT